MFPNTHLLLCLNLAHQCQEMPLLAIYFLVEYLVNFLHLYLGDIYMNVLLSITLSYDILFIYYFIFMCRNGQCQRPLTEYRQRNGIFSLLLLYCTIRCELYDNFWGTVAKSCIIFFLCSIFNLQTKKLKKIFLLNIKSSFVVTKIQNRLISSGLVEFA